MFLIRTLSLRHPFPCKIIAGHVGEILPLTFLAGHVASLVVDLPLLLEKKKGTEGKLCLASIQRQETMGQALIG